MHAYINIIIPYTIYVENLYQEDNLLILLPAFIDEKFYLR